MNSRPFAETWIILFTLQLQLIQAKTKPGKCIGRTVGEAENSGKTAIMSLFGRDKVPSTCFTVGDGKRHSCKFMPCLFIIQTTEVIKERKSFRATFHHINPNILKLYIFGLYF